jgi:dimethylamine--corrinoid protein Co-methyltransferase
MAKIFARMGDGFPVEMSESELREDIEQGTRDAADKGKIPALSDDEQAYLFEMCQSTCKMTGVAKGNEIVLTYDGGTNKVGRLGVSMGRIQVLQLYERCFGADTTELSDVDYSYKQVKPVIREDVPVMEQAQLLMVAPVFYGAMPNLGLYTQPDGPCPNPSELMPQGKIAEAQEAYVGTIEHAVRDIDYVASAYWEAGADGINFDTVGASGDPDFKASLLAVEKLKQKYPEMCIEVGMAGEFVLGMHAELTHGGVRLAGLYPHDQVRLAQESGVDIFGPAINTVSNRSLPWNVARAVTFTKACVDAAEIPVHGNMGMGVGGLPVCDPAPADAVSLASRAMVELTRLDGL